MKFYGKIMKQAKLYHPVPDFVAVATGLRKIQLSNLRNQKLLLFFYPKNGSPNCTILTQDFAANHHHFDQCNTAILGITRDTLEQNDNFKKQLCLPYDLVSDSNDALCHMFQVIKQKEKFGQTVDSLERSSFLIDEQGILIYEWRDIPIKNHVHNVVQAIKVLDQHNPLISSQPSA